MRGALMRLFTEEQHKDILSRHSNTDAAEEYSEIAGQPISRSLVNYWRKVFITNNGNLAKTDRELKETRKLLVPGENDDVADTRWVPKKAESILVIPDLHAPYQHQDALAFLCKVRDTFLPDVVMNTGDEFDYHAMSFHDSDPNLESAGTELEQGKQFLSDLHTEFNKMLICHSNHGSMVYRRAKAHGIPVQLIKRYRDIIDPTNGVPEWSWAFGWKISTPLGDVMFKHQSSSSILADAAHNACNLVVGHQHGNFSVEYSASSAHLYYGVYAGCLVDKDSLAFAYGKNSGRKPILGCVVILEGRPMLIPMVLDTNGRWIGRL